MSTNEVIQRYLDLLHTKAVEFYRTTYPGTLTPPTYTLEPGSKYIRVVSDNGRHRHVHSFIDKTTGDLYKPAGWKAPAKGVRYNLFKDFSTLELRIDPYGGYLYKHA